MSIPDELTQPVELEVSDAIDLLCNGELTV
jgi:hypothetical protein